MRTLIDAAALRAAAQRAAAVADADSARTLGVRLTANEGALVLEASGSEGSSRSTLDAETVEAGTVSLNARWLAALAEALPDCEVTAEDGDGGLMLHGGGARVSMRAMPSDITVAMPEAPDATATPDDGALEALVASVRHAVSRDVNHPGLMAVHVTGADGRLCMEATDMYRAARAWVAADADCDALVPGEWLSRVASGAGSIGLTERNAFVGGPGFLDSSPLIDAEPVQITRLFDQAEQGRLLVTVDRRGLMGAIRALKSIDLDSKDPTRVVLRAGADGLRVSLSTDDAAGDRLLDADLGDEALDAPVTFNASYLSDALGAIEGERVCIRTGANAVKPVLVTPEGDGACEQLVVPMRDPRFA